MASVFLEFWRFRRPPPVSDYPSIRQVHQGWRTPIETARPAQGETSAHVPCGCGAIGVYRVFDAQRTRTRRTLWLWLFVVPGLIGMGMVAHKIIQVLTTVPVPDFPDVGWLVVVGILLLTGSASKHLYEHEDGVRLDGDATRAANTHVEFNSLDHNTSFR
ncbi:hypothetical protein [Nocardia sp. CA-119907]|uniref:hypothetical protein n=1 Tax=Nocardia sp. CA-119907 TaxID=3239973 RepID=UPI003D975380